MTRVAINGFGRIGRNFFRAYLERRPGYEIVAVNDIGDPKTMAHLLEFDSRARPARRGGQADAETITVGEQRTAGASRSPNPAKLPWRELGIDVVVESTGRFEKREKAQAHLDAGARTVLISAVANDADVTIVLGVNDDAYDPERHRIVSNASCTTNCVTPLAKVLHEAFGIERGFMTTVHAYTPTQPLLDAPHKDLRRARAAAINLIPTTTGATRALGTVLPELEGKIGAHRDPGAGPGRLDRRSRRRALPPGRARRGERAFRQRPPRRGRSPGSSATPTSRSSRATSSARPTRASSTAS